MSCALALAAALVATDPAAAATPAPPPASLATEPLYAEIIARAEALHDEVAAFRGAGVKGAPKPWPGLAGVKAQAAALSELDMKGHRDLAARAVDGDLKCILKGISEDLSRKIEQLETATTGADQDAALSDLIYLLDDNSGVLLAPLKPPV
ncbi:hypothetical protein [Caulobacter sp. 17J80-11]|uniref:hypothetical protein n=1 Tax=Caulobacter sp. 17J80-11 TaxID=2763502 RepID=UPI0016538156|nr:hypothetical protein [Caulobacter sp. 17J80-11]MBC6980212.1 hypothetical protein [Caulobacter sp. 17J80-11]